ncbi:hypothetical protein BDV36DRAFT_247999 [Aspergillus pseudocaelatus]|uniref:Uncharacterized protein n=1 Tax=Aspergillus pseudocaelatus TaxID=1825620 RepID=A0ABQ6WVZ7_9EURO|nr:hypothetical protein BDV36DRAFT_247999 [Aspergillus pseudocaelatus]
MWLTRSKIIGLGSAHESLLYRWSSTSPPPPFTIGAPPPPRSFLRTFQLHSVFSMLLFGYISVLNMYRKEKVGVVEKCLLPDKI